MHVLVTNDDGLDSPGIWALAQAAQALGKVTVVAPSTDQSGKSVALGLRRPTQVEHVEPERVSLASGSSEVIAVDGTPATCVLLGCCRLSEDPFDLVLAGINHGANVASDIWLSGTIGAARMGWLLGIPGLGVSLDHDRRAHDGTLHWAAAATLAVAMSRHLAAFEHTSLVSLNVPNQPLAALRGALPTFPSVRSRLVGCNMLEIDPATYSVRFEPWATGTAEEGSDLWALDHGLASASLLSSADAEGFQPDLASICEQVSRELGLPHPAVLPGPAPAPASAPLG